MGGWAGPGTGCPEQLWLPLNSWKCPKPGWMGLGAPKCFGSSGKCSSVCQGRTFVPFGGILEREVSGRGFSTVFEQPAARKLKKREHRYLWAEVNKSNMLKFVRNY
uniref:Uncharacterized protein n=1 Tax=Catharus ustulatus TaxID=91951 RepID=A0A8C3TS04_CATUS